MKNINIGHLMEVAAELALREFRRYELGSSGYSRRELYLKYVSLARKNYLRIFWRKLNEFAFRSYRGQCREPLSLGSLRYCFMFRRSDSMKLIDVDSWLQVALSNTSYFLTETKGKVYITATDMGTYPVNMSADRLLDMINAYDAYMSTDIDSFVKDVMISCNAQIKADELLTAAAESMVADLIKGKHIGLSMHEHKDRVYCKVEVLNCWNKQVSFRTTLETFRKDFLVNCHKARISVNIRKDNEQMLKAAAKKNPVYEILGKASFLKNVDICPMTRNKTTVDGALRFDGDPADIFKLGSRRNYNSYAFDEFCDKELASHLLHSPNLLCMLCFAPVTEKNPIVMDIDGKSVKFTMVDFECDGEVVKLFSKDHDIILLLDSVFTEYLSFGKQKGIDGSTYAKHYSKMASTMNELGLEFTGDSLQSANGVTRLHAKGLAKMLSHAVGFADHYSMWKGMLKVYYGSILYRFPDHMDGGKLASYTKAHESWCKGLNSMLGSRANVKVIKTPFIYQDVFSGRNSGCLPERVKEFYGF